MNFSNRRTRRYIFPIMIKSGLKTTAVVLWGNQFDETMAITFLSMLRQGAIDAQLVSVHGRLMAGRCGVTLMADLTLSDVYPMVEQIAAVIVPSHSPYLGALTNDPRVLRFLSRANACGATLTTGQLSRTDAELLSIPKHRIESVEPIGDYGTAAVMLRRALQALVNDNS